MTGPEHYRAGETLLAAGTGDSTERGTNCLAAATAHFVAALVAATAQSADLDVPEWTAWRRVLGRAKGGAL